MKKEWWIIAVLLLVIIVLAIVVMTMLNNCVDREDDDLYNASDEEVIWDNDKYEIKDANIECLSDSDCSGGYKCIATGGSRKICISSGIAKTNQIDNDIIECLSDSDCSGGYVCTRLSNEESNKLCLPPDYILPPTG